MIEKEILQESKAATSPIEFTFYPKKFAFNEDTERRTWWRESVYTAEVSKNRAEYFSQKMVDLFNKLVNQVINNECDIVFFADKSARPLAYMLTKLWRALCPEIPLPEIKFINVGRESRDKNLDEAKKIFEPYVTGKKVTIVDETSESGKTLEYAKTILLDCGATHVSSLIAFPLGEVASLGGHAIPAWGAPVALGVIDKDLTSVLIGRYTNKEMNGVRYHRKDLKNFVKRVVAATKKKTGQEQQVDETTDPIEKQYSPLAKMLSFFRKE